MKKIIILLATMVAPIMAFAHVKWFVDSEEVISRSHGATAFYNWSSKEVLVWSLITIITVFIFSIIDRYAKTPKRILDIEPKELHQKTPLYIGSSAMVEKIEEFLERHLELSGK